MPEIINEPVSVALWSNHITRKTIPYSLYWRDRQYQIKQVGFHHMYRQGRVLTHVFSVTDGSIFFKLTLDTETLAWRLSEMYGL